MKPNLPIRLLFPRYYKEAETAKAQLIQVSRFYRLIDQNIFAQLPIVGDEQRIIDYWKLADWLDEKPRFHRSPR